MAEGLEALTAFDPPSPCPQQVAEEGPWTSRLLQHDHPLDRWFWNDPVPHLPRAQSCSWHSEGLLASCTPDSLNSEGSCWNLHRARRSGFGSQAGTGFCSPATLFRRQRTRFFPLLSLAQLPPPPSIPLPTKPYLSFPSGPRGPVGNLIKNKRNRRRTCPKPPAWVFAGRPVSFPTGSTRAPAKCG